MVPPLASVRVGVGTPSSSGANAPPLRPRPDPGGPSLAYDFRSDPAFSRRFAVVRIEERSDDETLQIIRALAPAYEGRHAVRVQDDAVEAIVTLALVEDPVADWLLEQDDARPAPVVPAGPGRHRRADAGRGVGRPRTAT
jgi:hypothetical protein